jgi:hypothetical protein
LLFLAFHDFIFYSVDYETLQFQLSKRDYVIKFFKLFFGGLECVGHPFAYVAHFVFLRDVCIRTQT